MPWAPTTKEETPPNSVAARPRSWRRSQQPTWHRGGATDERKKSKKAIEPKASGLDVPTNRLAVSNMSEVPELPVFIDGVEVDGDIP